MQPGKARKAPPRARALEKARVPANRAKRQTPALIRGGELLTRHAAVIDATLFAAREVGLKLAGGRIRFPGRRDDVDAPYCAALLTPAGDLAMGAVKPGVEGMTFTFTPSEAFEKSVREMFAAEGITAGRELDDAGLPVLR